MSSVAIEILVVLALVLANGIFAMSEMAIVSSRKVRLQDMADRGDAKAQAALHLANSPNQFLSTVQVGITLISILQGAGGAAPLANRLAVPLSQIPGLRPYSQPLSFGIVVVAITYLSLILGELVPKRLALNSPEKIAVTVAAPMRHLSAIAHPLVHLLSISTEAVSRLFGDHHSAEEQWVTEDEIKVIVRQSAEAGMLEAAEQDMVERVFHLGDQQVSALMTPRLDIVWLDLNDPIDVNRQKIIASGHGRFPVCHDNLDNVVGIAHVTHLLERCLSGQPLDLTANLRQPLFIPENTSGFRLLESFKQSGTHMALIVDEYGVTQGLVTLNDVMEVIIEDIPFADHPYESPMIQREDGSWLMDGMLPIDKFCEVFDLEEVLEDERGGYQTLGGFVINQLGRIPSSSDHFEWEGLRFEVMDMDGNRVDKMLVAPIAPSQPPQDNTPEE